MVDNDLLFIVKLDNNVVIKPFDCNDADLNGFLHDDAKDYYDELMSVTYLVEYDEKELAAYFCLMNDKIVFDFSGKDDPTRKIWQKFNKENKIHFKKHRKNYPAVKIGRLAVDVNFRDSGVGRFIIELIKTTLTRKRDIGCRFITVDAYKQAFGFYLKNGFEFLSSEDENDSTRLMYFDLKKVVIPSPID